LIESEDFVGGTACIVDSTAATEVAAVGVWYGRGSRDERENEKGSTHFIEHMLFKGTRTRNAFQIAREIDSLGGSINAFTEREAVSFFAIVPADGFEKTAEILIDMTQNAVFDANEFERERTVIENELSAAEDDPEEVATDAFAELLWKDHPLGRKIGGTSSDVAGLKRDTVYNTFENCYSGSADLVTVAGDVSFDRVKKTFAGAFPISQKPVKRIAPIWPSASGAFFKSAPFQHVQIFCSFQLPGVMSQSSYYGLQVANTAMGDSMSSRLFQTLREQRGLCYSIYSAPSLLSDATLWTIFASSTIDTLPQLVEGIAEEIVRLFDSNGFSKQEISDSKAQIRGGMKLESMDIEHRMRRIARQKMYNTDPISISDSSELVSVVTANETNESLFHFIRESEPLIFALGPAKAKKSFMLSAEKLVKKLGVFNG